ncbi:MAG: hypothetical protein AAFV95_11345 [Bacteroidota bacterium]
MMESKVDPKEMFSKDFIREITPIVILYCFMAAVYYVALVIDTGVYYLFKGIGLNYLIKALLTAPLWWFFSEHWRHHPFGRSCCFTLSPFPYLPLSGCGSTT